MSKINKKLINPEMQIKNQGTKKEKYESAYPSLPLHDRSFNAHKKEYVFNIQLYNINLNFLSLLSQI